MAWNWRYENVDGQTLGTSEDFESRGDAETWIGQEFAELAEQGIVQVTLFNDETYVFGPMGLIAE